MPLDEAFSGARPKDTERVEGLADLLSKAAPEIEEIKAGLFSAKEQNKIDAIKVRRNAPVKRTVCGHAKQSRCVSMTALF